MFYVSQKQKIGLLVELIKRYQPGRAIVFTRTKHGADRVVRHLTEAGIRSDAIHSNKSQNKRQRILDEFKWTNPPILVATDIAARGIDVDEVSHVFNYDMPQEPETYVHRIGRSGRAGATGLAISFCDPDEKKMLRAIEALIQKRIPLDPASGDIVPAVLPKKQSESGSREDRSPRKGARPPRDRSPNASGKVARPRTGDSKRRDGAKPAKPIASKKVASDRPVSNERPQKSSSPPKTSNGPKKGSIGKKHRRSRSGQRS